jgi:MFS family permease
MINFSGFGLTLLPFYVVLAKKSFGLTGKQIGAYLLLQIIGMIISNFVWARLVKRNGFRGVFKGCILIGTMLPLLAITLAHFPIYFYLSVFFISGFGISAREVSAEGIFIEISKDENRALYRGITGAMSLSTALFPLMAGGLIGEVGFVPIFIFSSLMVAISYYFVHGLGDVSPVQSQV